MTQFELDLDLECPQLKENNLQHPHYSL